MVAALNYEPCTNPVAIRRCSFRIAAVRAGRQNHKWPGCAGRLRATAFAASSTERATTLND
jgi:hypothetical protein